MKVDRVTITGADDSTNSADLFAMAGLFPWVEFGILLSKSQEGSPRFPSTKWIEDFISADGAAGSQLHLSAHLCGSWVRDLCVGKRTFQRDRPMFAKRFQRIQLNVHAITHTLDDSFLLDALRALGAEEFIFELDDVNNTLLDVANDAGVRAVPLFDISGGAGVLPWAWPTPPLQANGYSGYAGGLSPDNLRTQLSLIGQAVGESRIWIDVETHVRTDDNLKLDMDKVARFLTTAAPYVTA